MAKNKVALNTKQSEFLKFFFETEDLKAAAEAFQHMMIKEGLQPSSFVAVLNVVMERYEKRK